MAGEGMGGGVSREMVRRGGGWREVAGWREVV